MSKTFSRTMSAFFIVGTILSSLFIVQATSLDVTFLETPVSVAVTPATHSLAAGATYQFAATATFEDESTLVITSNSNTVWASSAPTRATVNATGLASALASGSTTISATYGGVAGSAVLTIPSSGRPTSTITPTPETSSDTETSREETDTEDSTEGDEDTESSDETTEDTDADTTTETDIDQNDTENTDADSTISNDSDVESTIEQGDDDIPGDPPAEGEDGLSPPPPGDEQFTIGEDFDLPSVISEDTPLEFQFITPFLSETPESGEGFFEETLRDAPVFLPDDLSVTRGELLQMVNTEFDLDERFQDVLKACYSDFSPCMSIFLSVTPYTGVVLDDLTVKSTNLGSFMPSFDGGEERETLFNFGSTQLYPDVPPTSPYAYDINVSTLLSNIQGYYNQENGPFRPYRVVNRIEALKVLMGSVDLIDWVYFDDYVNSLGGERGLRTMTTPFSDVSPTEDAMWWYPRYLNLACEIGVLVCTPDSPFRPNDFVTEEELEGMMSRLKLYMESEDYTEGQGADDDFDGLTNYMERKVYLTDYLNEDTDGDLLRDGEEILVHKTSPFLADSDGDGVSDYDEVKVYGTNPLKMDSDDDGFTDSIEIELGSDPLDEMVMPVDEDKNSVDDVWEETFAITVIDGIQDTDGDGVSDKVEYQWGTNPTLVDTDNDGYSDAEEILDYGTNPLDSNDPGELENDTVVITNFSENQLVGDTTPFVKGRAPAGLDMKLLLRNDYGHEKVLGSTTADENNVFLFQTPVPLPSGRYILMARVLDPVRRDIVSSKPVHVVIDEELNVVSPAPRRLSNIAIPSDALLKNLRLQIRDNRPVLAGETDFGSVVTASWRSLVTSSILIADAASGEFEIAPPRSLEIGNHEVFVTATRKGDNAQSDTLRLQFKVLGGGFDFGAGFLRGVVGDGLDGAIKGFLPMVGGFAQEQPFLFGLMVVVLVGLLGSGVYYFMLSRKRK